MSEPKDDLVTLLDDFGWALGDRLCTAGPARVKAWNKDKQTIDVEPLLPKVFWKASGTRVVQPVGLISNVPLHVIGSGGCWLEFPVAVDDPVFLIVADSALERWKATGDLADPVIVRQHHMTDAIAIAGVRPPGRALAGLSGQHVVLHVAAGVELRLGSNTGTDKVAIDSLVRAELDRLWSVIHTHVHAGGVLAGALTGVSASTGTAGNVGSSTVKAKP